jgi:hypothetical protein
MPRLTWFRPEHAVSSCASGVIVITSCSPNVCKGGRPTTTTTVPTALSAAKTPYERLRQKTQDHCHRPSSVAQPSTQAFLLTYLATGKGWLYLCAVRNGCLPACAELVGSRSSACPPRQSPSHHGPPSHRPDPSMRCSSGPESIELAASISSKARAPACPDSSPGSFNRCDRKPIARGCPRYAADRCF